MIPQAPSRGRVTVVDGKIKRVPDGVAPSSTIRHGEVLLQAGAPSVSVVQPEAPRPDPTQITVRPVALPQRMSFLGTSFKTVSGALAEVFGSFPVRLTREHLSIVHGMAAVAGEGRGPYDQIAAALDKHGDVELGVE